MDSPAQSQSPECADALSRFPWDPAPHTPSCPWAQELHLCPDVGVGSCHRPCCKCACLQSRPLGSIGMCVRFSLALPPLLRGLLEWALDWSSPSLCPGLLMESIASLWWALWCCAMAGEGTACAGIILGSQLIPPLTVVELPDAWYRCNLIGMTLLCDFLVVKLRVKNIIQMGHALNAATFKAWV